MVGIHILFFIFVPAAIGIFIGVLLLFAILFLCEGQRIQTGGIQIGIQLVDIIQIAVEHIHANTIACEAHQADRHTGDRSLRGLGQIAHRRRGNIGTQSHEVGDHPVVVPILGLHARNDELFIDLAALVQSLLSSFRIFQTLGQGLAIHGAVGFVGTVHGAFDPLYAGFIDVVITDGFDHIQYHSPHVKTDEDTLEHRVIGEHLPVVHKTAERGHQSVSGLLARCAAHEYSHLSGSFRQLHSHVVNMVHNRLNLPDLLRSFTACLDVLQCVRGHSLFQFFYIIGIIGDLLLQILHIALRAQHLCQGFGIVPAQASEHIVGLVKDVLGAGDDIE